MGRIELLRLDYLMGPMGRMRHVLYSDTLCCFFFVLFFLFSIHCELGLSISSRAVTRLARAGTMHFT